MSAVVHVTGKLGHQTWFCTANQSHYSLLTKGDLYIFKIKCGILDFRLLSVKLDKEKKKEKKLAFLRGVKKIKKNRGFCLKTPHMILLCMYSLISVSYTHLRAHET